MLLNVRSMSISGAVICFFLISITGWCSGLSPLTCCKRSLIAAVIAYIITNCAARLINAVLMNAIVKSQAMKKEQEFKNREN
jgi:hypothetical protein